MSALLGLDDVINRLTGGAGAAEILWFHKQNRVSGAAGVTVAGQWSSLWRYEGFNSSAGVAPTSAANPTRATAGALGQANPGGGRQKWLIGAGLGSGMAGTYLFYDRLAHMGGLDGNSASAQTVGLSLSRYTDGVGVIPAIEIHTLIGATGRTVTMSYTDENDNPQTTAAVAIGGTGLREVERLIFAPLVAGNRGCKAVADLTLSAGTGTVGSFGVVLLKPLFCLTVDAIGNGNIKDFIAGFPQPLAIATDACIAAAFLAQTTTGAMCVGNIISVEA